jgi:hypothetical protein
VSVKKQKTKRINIGLLICVSKTIKKTKRFNIRLLICVSKTTKKQRGLISDY